LEFNPQRTFDAELNANVAVEVVADIVVVATGRRVNGPVMEPPEIPVPLQQDHRMVLRVALVSLRVVMLIVVPVAGPATAENKLAAPTPTPPFPPGMENPAPPICALREKLSPNRISGASWIVFFI
jgi:hypothetical protein